MSKALHHLLVTLPLNRTSFLERLSASHVGDAVRTWSSSAPDRVITPEELWGSYARLARRIEEIAQLSTRLGVKVWLDATFADLNAAMSEDVPLTLVAHWKDAQVSPSDLRAPQSTLRMLGRTAVGEYVMVRQLVGPAELARIRVMPGADATEELAKALQSVVVDCDIDPTAIELCDDPDEYRHARNREMLNRLFARDIVPGNRMELWDSMIDAQAFTSTIMPSRTKAIDLAVCNSAVVARTLQFTHDCPVIANRRPTSILLRLRLYEQAIIHVARTGAPYVETLMQLRDDLDDLGGSRNESDHHLAK